MHNAEGLFILGAVLMHAVMPEPVLRPVHEALNQARVYATDTAGTLLHAAMAHHTIAPLHRRIAEMYAAAELRTRYARRVAGDVGGFIRHTGSALFILHWLMMFINSEILQPLFLASSVFNRRHELASEELLIAAYISLLMLLGAFATAQNLYQHAPDLRDIIKETFMRFIASASIMLGLAGLLSPSAKTRFTNLIDGPAPAALTAEDRALLDRYEPTLDSDNLAHSHCFSDIFPLEGVMTNPVKITSVIDGREVINHVDFSNLGYFIRNNLLIHPALNLEYGTPRLQLRSIAPDAERRAEIFNFLRDLELIDPRHSSTAAQEAYDRRFGLVISPAAPAPAATVFASVDERLFNERNANPAAREAFDQQYGLVIRAP